jgi:hypothetical protein
MPLLALPAMAMRRSHQGAGNLESHPAAQAAAAQRRHSAASLAWSPNTQPNAGSDTGKFFWEL